MQRLVEARDPHWRLASVALAGALAVWLAQLPDARAEPQIRSRVEAPARHDDRHDHRHLVYVDLLGKNGLYGIGYEARPFERFDRFSVGASIAFYNHDDERVVSVSPYLGLYPLSSRRHRCFVHLGPQLIRRQIESPVPGWQGMESTALGAHVSTGYEWRVGRLVGRAYLMTTVGQGGISPWAGLSLGVAL